MTSEEGEVELPENNENILNHSLNEEMKTSYINYAMSVIIGRALPDARDGLKPVHRRVLYGMHEGGHTSEKKYSKSARSVGEVMGKYHPHGDQSIYDTMVRMAQDFSLRYPLVAPFFQNRIDMQSNCARNLCKVVRWYSCRHPDCYPIAPI